MDYSCFYHEELELSEGRVSLVPAPRSLHLNGGKDRAVRALILIARIVYRLVNLDTIRDAGEQFFTRILLVVKVRKLQKAHHINVGNIYCILRQELLNLLNQHRDNTPSGDVLSLKSDILWRLVIESTILHCKLRICCHVLSFLNLAPDLFVFLIFTLHAFLEALHGFGVNVVAFWHKSIIVVDCGFVAPIYIASRPWHC